MSPRVLAFFGVGSLGFVVQMSLLAFLTEVAQWPPGAATVVAVEAAVLHNFWWHERWTWRDRTAGSMGVLKKLARFHAANGLLSVAGNLAIALAGVHVLGSTVGIANVIAVSLMSLANYRLSDRWVFAHGSGLRRIASSNQGRPIG